MKINAQARVSVWLYTYNNLHAQLKIEFFDADFACCF